MNYKADVDPADLRNIILNTSEPLIIKNLLDWDLLNWNVHKWQDVLGDEPLQFRVGKNCYTKAPQFENTTETIPMTFKKFLDYQEVNSHEWLYFDYKYLKDWLLNFPELRSHINWTKFGFPNRNVEESTIWIGSKGAHTPCHIDTYGCNIVAQIFGRKRWILFPPEQNLYPTRIPYEESSIYSSINLFAPNSGNCTGISRCRTVVLNPGDVLILPHRWWHFVENLELAISINTWIELPIDYEERIGESVVSMLVSQLSKQLNPELQQYVLNPTDNLQETLHDESFADSLKLTMTCLEQFKIEKEKVELKQGSMGNKEEILQKLKNVQVIKQLSEDDCKKLFDMQKSRFDSVINEMEVPVIQNEDESRLKKIMNAVLHNDVINLIKEKLLKD